MYHKFPQDMGNLNVTVFTSQQEFCRKNIVKDTCAALNKKWNLNLSFSGRHDIFLNEKLKVVSYIIFY